MNRTMKIENKTAPVIEYAACNTSTVKLVNLCNERAWWFYYLRAPLIAGMRLMVYRHRIDPSAYRLRTESCCGCVRFIKTALKEKSPVFRFLNNRINQVFDNIVERLVIKEELLEAKQYARQATHPPAGQTPPRPPSSIAPVGYYNNS
jgi:hypothetical protein